MLGVRVLAEVLRRWSGKFAFTFATQASLRALRSAREISKNTVIDPRGKQ